MLARLAFLHWLITYHDGLKSLIFFSCLRSLCVCRQFISNDCRYKLLLPSLGEETVIEFLAKFPANNRKGNRLFYIFSHVSFVSIFSYFPLSTFYYLKKNS